ncbi:histidine kinase [Pricia sp. S334]|uniref:Histidine kinase n=1 Tax=Pricia mediterranea TaxID=3076079 RepID=A0ABU3L051_9FLAO|nr:histidine kinase [Pricia sp. S334]MDT7827110.1 histidine kinase [Pricia sp. S334]
MNRKKMLIALWLFLALVTTAQLILTEIYKPGTFSFFDIVVSPIGSLATGIPLLFLVVIPFFDYTAKYSNRIRMGYLAAFAFVYTTVYILILLLIFTIVYGESFEDYKSGILNFGVGNFHNMFKNYLFQVAILYAYEYISKQADLITAKKDLEIELNQSKLQILRSQLQPHFLFNALNSVVSVIDENKRKAQEMLVSLGDILRTSLNTDFRQLIPLSKELEYLENYLSIEKIRYEGQLHYRVEVGEAASRLKVPSLILQPIVENAIKHGFVGLHRPLQIVVSADAQDRTIIVKNNGAELTDNKGNFGLRNVRERLSIYYPGQEPFRIYQEGNWTINKINLG